MMRMEKIKTIMSIAIITVITLSRNGVSRRDLESRVEDFLATKHAKPFVYQQN